MIVVTLVCCYLACERPTKRQGVLDLKMATVRYPDWQIPDSAVVRGGHHYVAPLIVANSFQCKQLKPRRKQMAIEIHYYVWFFGLIVELPYTKQLLGPPSV